MFKNILLTSTLLFLAVIVLCISVFKTIAKANTSFSVTPVASVAPTPSASLTSKYYLAYPGLLPDHFLYPIKMARDKVLLFLTRDPLKKAELSLLFADKRLGAGKALVEGGKAELAVSTLGKGEIYLEQATKFAEEAKSKGQDVSGFYAKLAEASIKHQEVLTEISQKIPDQAKGSIDKISNYSKNAYEAATK